MSVTHGLQTRLETIMVIDDEPENLHVLEESFAHTDYHICMFTRGAQAIAAALKDPPDVILLDVRMPEMDGYETCRRFKADDRLRVIPILFLSSMASIEDIAHGFACGAVDYIAKPFSEAEVLARVRTHLALRQAYVELENQHQRLQVLERQRDTYVHMLVHDMRSPLMAMLGHLQLVNAYGTKNLGAEDVASLRSAIHCTRMLSRMVSTVVDLSRMEQAHYPLQWQTATVAEVFQSARDQVLDPSQSPRIIEQIADTCPALHCDCELTVRLIANLLANAVKYAPDSSAIVMGAKADADGGIRLWVQDQGPGISADDHDKIFEKFSVAQSPRSLRTPSTGLGLAFCRLAANTQGGTIGVESQPGHGSTFWVVLQATKSRT